MRKGFSEQLFLVTLYLTLLFGSGLVPEQATPHFPNQDNTSCKST